MLYSLAAAGGDKKVIQHRADCQKWMTPSEIAKGQALAAQMSMILSSGYILADLRLTSVSGRPGLRFYRNGFSCEFTFTTSRQPGAQEKSTDLFSWCVVLHLIGKYICPFSN